MPALLFEDKAQFDHSHTASPRLLREAETEEPGTRGENEPPLVQPAKPAAPPAMVPFGGVKPSPQ